MCRLLAVRSKEDFEIAEHLEKLALISKNSKEYQGHGWGCSYLDKADEWKHYKNIKPIWEDDFTEFPKTKLLVAHARSAFQDKGIKIENNMPFYDNKYVFVFNGELRGVRIKEEGRIGAEKIFNFIKRFDEGNIKKALEKGASIIKNNSGYIRGMNIIIADKKHIFLYTFFSQEPDYYTMHYKEGKELVVCSESYPDEKGWHSIANDTLEVW